MFKSIFYNYIPFALYISYTCVFSAFEMCTRFVLCFIWEQRKIQMICTQCKYKNIRYSPRKVLLFPFFRAFTVRSLALSAPLRSRSPFTKRSLCVHLSFSPFSFIFIGNSKIKGSVFAIHSKIIKEPVRKGWRKLILLIKHNFNKNLIRKI